MPRRTPNFGMFVWRNSALSRSIYRIIIGFISGVRDSAWGFATDLERDVYGRYDDGRLTNMCPDGTHLNGAVT